MHPHPSKQADLRLTLSNKQSTNRLQPRSARLPDSRIRLSGAAKDNLPPEPSLSKSAILSQSPRKPTEGQALYHRELRSTQIDMGTGSKFPAMPTRLPSFNPALQNQGHFDPPIRIPIFVHMGTGSLSPSSD